MSTTLIRFVAGLLVALPLLQPASVLADPPARVGRLALIENEVEFRLQRDEAAAPATRNWPVSSGAMLETGARGRAEVWIDATAFRLDGDSRIEFTTIDDRQVVLDVDAGSLSVSILESDQAADLVVRVPEGSIRFAEAGRYRIDVLSDRSELSTQAGLATVEQDGRQTSLAAGNKARLYPGGDLRLTGDDRPDAFDRWVAERERATLADVSRRHVSPYMTGYQDLDAHGDWRPHDEYGSVWYPRAVAVDWAPYRFGRWAWVAPWGWTWIDAAPWGFAPFHYGRWVLIHGRWAWVPGRRAERPVYAPALVAWIGNPGWSVSFSFGSAPAVGWFPLAPREVYVPVYRYSPTYIRRINVTHVHNVTIIDRAARVGHAERFAHRDSPQAVTVVPTRQLREGRAITDREFRRVDRQALSRAPVPGAAVSQEWLAPPPRAERPRADERRDRAERDARRAAEAPWRAPAADAPRRAGPESRPSPRDDRPRAEERRGAAERDSRRELEVAPRRAPDADVPRRAEPEARPSAPRTARPQAEERRDVARDARRAPDADAPRRAGPESSPALRSIPAQPETPPARRELRPAPAPETAAPRPERARPALQRDEREPSGAAAMPLSRPPAPAPTVTVPRAPQPQAAPQLAPERQRDQDRDRRGEARQPSAARTPQAVPQRPAPPAVSRPASIVDDGARREARSAQRPPPAPPRDSAPATQLPGRAAESVKGGPPPREQRAGGPREPAERKGRGDERSNERGERGPH